MRIERGVEAEQSVIGAWFLDANKAAKLLLKKVKLEYFFNNKAREIYAAILEIYASNKRVDVVKVLHKLTGNEGDNKVFLATCAESVPLCESALEYAEIMEENFKARELKKLMLTEISAESIEENIETISTGLANLAKGDIDGGARSVSEITAEQYLRLFEQNLSENRMETGFYKLDFVLKGFYRKNLVILAARPGVGKSAMALRMALNIAKTGKRVGFYSLEMSTDEIYERMIAMEAPFNLNKLKDKDFSATDMAKIADTSAKIKSWPLYINDGGYQTVERIKIETKLKNFDIVFIDYLQLLGGMVRKNRTEEVTLISRDLKCLAMDLNIPVVTLSQLNRDADETREPRLRDLRESGSIEQDANIVLMMWKDERGTGESFSEYIPFKIAKNRSGRQGGVVFEYTGSVMGFQETNLEMPVAKTRSKKPPWEE